MRTNIVIDDVLMRDVLRVTGLKTKREAVEMGLRSLLRLRQQEDVRKFRGKLHWEGNLDEMRASRFPDWDSKADGGAHSEPAVRQRSFA